MNHAIKFSGLLLCSVAMVCSLNAVGETVSHLPEAHSLSRYTAMWEKSPFSPESVIPETVSNAQWLMTGMTVFDNAPIVTLTNRNTMKTVSLSPGQSVESVSLISAEWADEYEKSYAVVTINGSQKKISFDQKSLATLSSRSAPMIAKTTNTAQNQQKVVPNQNNAGANITAPPNTNTKRVIPRRRIIRRAP